MFWNDHLYISEDVKTLKKIRRLCWHLCRVCNNKKYSLIRMLSLSISTNFYYFGRLGSKNIYSECQYQFVAFCLVVQQLDVSANWWICRLWKYRGGICSSVWNFIAMSESIVKKWLISILIFSRIINRQLGTYKSIYYFSKVYLFDEHLF